MLDLRNMDCMDLMAEFPDKYFELAIVDPPYNVGASDGGFGQNSADYHAAKMKHYANHDSVPDASYFKELFRVSKNQIIWGSNYYPEHLYHSGAVVWLKKEHGPLSDCEIAFQSFNKLVKVYQQNWCGFDHGGEQVNRIHPNQKPTRLYNWLLKNYAKPGDKVLDTHLGSMSIAIACHYMGYDLVGAELDKDYFEAGIKRVREETKQVSMF